MIIITKYTYGAFEGTNLNTILRRNGNSYADVCRHGSEYLITGDTIHQAFALGYHVVAVSDCLASFSTVGAEHSAQLHQMGLYIIENHFGTGNKLSGAYRSHAAVSYELPFARAQYHPGNR